jgi:hypothetical protein
VVAAGDRGEEGRVLAGWVVVHATEATRGTVDEVAGRSLARIGQSEDLAGDHQAVCRWAKADQRRGAGDA